MPGPIKKKNTLPFFPFIGHIKKFKNFKIDGGVFQYSIFSLMF